VATVNAIAEVRTKTEEAVGRIIDLLADRDGKVVAAVIEFGGTWGLAERAPACPFDALLRCLSPVHSPLV
jgi:hypothetical protein